MTLFINKTRGKYTMHKAFGSNVAWVIEWPIPSVGRVDWKLDLRRLAGRAGYSAEFDKAAAILKNNETGATYEVDGSSRPGDWRLVFVRFVDALHEGEVPLPDDVRVSDLFLPVAEVPPPAGLDDNFNPMSILKKRDKGQPVEMLRPLRAVSYSEAIRLGVDVVSYKAYGIIHGGKTELKLIECACGRLFVAHPKIIGGHKAQQWSSCGCTDAYKGVYKNAMRAAWREYCTMICLKEETNAALNKIFTEKGLCMDHDLPPFQDFWHWFLIHSRESKQFFVQRLDDSKPFTLDNLYMPKKRKLLKDNYNKDSFKISI